MYDTTYLSFLHQCHISIYLASYAESVRNSIRVVLGLEKIVSRLSGECKRLSGRCYLDYLENACRDYLVSARDSLEISVEYLSPWMSLGLQHSPDSPQTLWIVLEIIWTLETREY